MITCQRCHAQQLHENTVVCPVCGFALAQSPHQPRTTARPHLPVNQAAPPAPAPRTTPTAARYTPHPLSALLIALEQPNGYRYFLQGKSDYTIGRRSGHEIVPDADLTDAYGSEAGVSRQHVMIHVRENGVFVEDLESLNETVHNGFRLAPRQWYPLRNGDEIRLGAIILNVIFRLD